MQKKEYKKPTVECVSLPTMEALAGNARNENCADSAQCSS
jgi:hypothetical protein